MEQSIRIMTSRIERILHDNKPSIFLYGSVVSGDFKFGWSDIDILCLTENVIHPQQADELIDLRQSLQSENPENPYFGLFEGGLLTLEAFLHNSEDTVVYWGTSGQRIRSNYELCSFSKMDLLENGRLLYGNDFRHLITCPTRQEIVEAIKKHYNVIRQHGESGGSWLLDIARCLYTLRTNRVIAKTKAGEWAIEENLCPNISVMEKVVEIRKNPLNFNDEETKHWQSMLSEQIQSFTDVLEAELRTY